MNRIPVLMYHEISVQDESKKKIRRVYPGYLLSVDQFEQQMEYLSKNNFRSLSLNSLFQNEYSDQKRVVITFDDGFIGNYQYAFPILKKYGLQATIFVIVNQVDSDNYLNWQQLTELSRHGISIQSHTMTHRPLEELRTEEVFYELSMSKRILEEKLDQRVDYLSLPHGSFHPNLINIASEIGYLGICSSTFGYVDPPTIHFTIGRIPIKRGQSLKKFQQVISQDIRVILKYWLFLTVTNSLSKLIGLKNYSRLYRFIFHIQPEC